MFATMLLITTNCRYNLTDDCLRVPSTIASEMNQPSSIDELATLCKLCREAQHQWRELSLRDRLKPIKTFRRLLVEEHDLLCDAVQQDIGKDPQQTIGGEILPTADACKFLLKQAKHLLKPQKIPNSQRPVWMIGQKDVVHRRPRGIVGIIGTWNYPIILNTVQILQALTAGNGVIWKPSEVAPQTAQAVHALIEKSGYPDNLFLRVEATREGGSALIEADIDHLVFTGAADTGRKIAARLGERLISSSLELSGHDALFVLKDADVELAARAAWFGVTLNAGQTCLAVRRAFVHQSIMDDFVSLIRPIVEQSSPMRLATKGQVVQAQSLVDDVVSNGGKAIQSQQTNSHEHPVLAPTVLLGSTADSQILRVATFAPVMTIVPFNSIDEALALDALCPYALGASIFTGNIALGRDLGAKLSTGSVSINDVIATTAHPASPFGGNRESGWGLTQGKEGLLEMTVPQVLTEKKGKFRPHYDLVPGSKIDQTTLLKGMLQFAHGRNLWRRFRGFLTVLWNAKGTKSEEED